MLKILVAPSGFKESLDVWAVTEAIATGVQRAMPAAVVLKAPMVDGGEGFVRALVSETDGTIRRAVVTGPILLGERGVARRFGPQKGATPEQVVVLEQALEVYARHILHATGCNISIGPGTGASGGLGAGIVAFLGGRLRPRFEVIVPYLKLDELLVEADLVITGEGSLDGLTPIGKIPTEVARRAKAYGLPVVALAGTVGKGCAENFDHGIDAFASIIKRPCSLDESCRDVRKLLIRAAEDAVRMIGVGLKLGAKDVARPLAPRE